MMRTVSPFHQTLYYIYGIYHIFHLTFSCPLKKDIIVQLTSYLKCFLQPEHQQLIVDGGALTHLVDLLKRHNNGLTSRAINSLIRRAADAVTNLAHENSNIKTHVRFASHARSYI